MKDLYIAWWNVENLFDVQHSPHRPEWLQKQLNRELTGWDAQILDTKLNQLTKVIAAMNDHAGPDLLGVCEVENAVVMNMLLQKMHAALPNRQYAVAHHDGSDQRGVDTAFIYDLNILKAEMQFNRVIIKRYATRDLFQVNFTLIESGAPLVMIANHWPARSAGKYESEPYRIIAAETLSYWIERTTEIMGPNTPILVMGDFNDEPFDRSMTNYALSTNSKLKVSYSRTPKLYNPMFRFTGSCEGTFFYNNQPGILDQFLLNRPLMTGAGGVKPKTGPQNQPTDCAIFTIAEMISGGRYKTPIRFGRPSKGLNLEGFSDHFPITIRLRYP